jgi:hypothetical protein
MVKLFVAAAGRRFASAAVAALAAAAAVPCLNVRRCWAAEACAIAVVGEGPALDPWQDAARGLTGWAPAGGDCASVRVVVQRNGARLVFATRDGREAVRYIVAPAELGPALSALGETGAAGVIVGPASPLDVTPVVRSQPPPQTERSTPVGFRWAVQLGVSVAETTSTTFIAGASNATITHGAAGGGLLVGMLSFRFADWEIGPLGGLALANDARPSPFLAAGVGRRWNVSDTFVILTGVRAAFSMADGDAELVVGGYVGAAMALFHSMRLRAELDALSGPTAALLVGVER